MIFFLHHATTDLSCRAPVHSHMNCAEMCWEVVFFVWGLLMDVALVTISLQANMNIYPTT